MSILDNIKGARSGEDGDSGGKFNPFKLLEIGEIMARYTDGIRIKDFVFLAVLTSERLILIDSARQGSGQITKEIPFSVIKEAELERDERDRPTLAISMEVGGQHRVMRLVFTGLINEPDTECREWFTAINGYPPERAEPPEIRLDEPVPSPSPEPQRSYFDPEKSRQPVPPPVQPVYVPAPVMQSPSTPSVTPNLQTPVPSQPVPVVTAPPVEEIRTVQQPVQPPTPAYIPVKASDPVQPEIPRVAPMPSVPPATSIPPDARKKVPATRIQDGSIRILIEKPDLSPVRIFPSSRGETQRSVPSWKYCIQCGTRIPSQSRFCQACGSQQT
ncbi:MAG: zinc ribbon domain-containing protein [Methanospirillum sp.]|uniref:zinc ribbon domain-containing protein n=1 Tax=Methanospirillum sp. TaxID=45200 RepID=UPI0023705F11|nr:zinc ribbon domain-containing protein [Methanospirillum sp.]MDD1729533.1 zinc ribbon domain-containing protein [Methanospirillum sp.]